MIHTVHLPMIRKARHIPLGVAINPLFWDAPGYMYVANRYQLITPEVAGWYYVVSTRGWGEMDKIVEYSRQGGKPVFYHTLRWWFYDCPDYQAWIREAMGRYPTITDWIVVNEGYSGGRSTMPYIDESFVLARELRPDARLWYNGTLTDPYEQTMALRLIEAGLADGIGIQMHVNLNTDFTVYSGLLHCLKTMHTPWRVTELDCEIPDLSEWCITQQALTYSHVVQLCTDYDAEALTVWGVADGINKDWLPGSYPLPFGGDYQPKPAWQIFTGE